VRYASRDPPEVRRTGGWRRVGMTLCQLDGRTVAGWIEGLGRRGGGWPVGRFAGFPSASLVE
jgi:hypothetical protein